MEFVASTSIVGTAKRTVSSHLSRYGEEDVPILLINLRNTTRY